MGSIPIFAALFGLVLGTERLTRRFWVAAAVSFVGVALVAAGSGSSATGWLGILLGLSMCATWAAYSVVIAPLMQTYSPYRVSAIVVPAAWVLIALVGIPAVRSQSWDLEWQIWPLLVFATIGPLVLTNVLWFRSIHRIGPARATLATNLQPFVAAVLAVVLLSEPLTAAPGRRRAPDRDRDLRSAPADASAAGSLNPAHERTRLHADRRLGPHRDLGREREAVGVLLRARLRLYAHGLRRSRRRAVRDRASYVIEQGEIRFVLTSGLRADSDICKWAATKGDSVRDVALAVPDATHAYRQAVQRGARGVVEPHWVEDEHGRVELAAIATYGDNIHTFVNRSEYSGAYLPGYQSLAENGSGPARGVGLIAIDHVVGNVELGRMDEWVDFYARVLGFTQLTHFSDEDISTEYSALMSKVMTDGEGKIKFPINEPAEGKRKSQIEEYLEFHGGPGVQHVAMQSDDIVRTVAWLREHGVLFIATPDTYYEVVQDRVGEHRGELGRPALDGHPRRPRRGGLPAPALHEDRPGPPDAVLRGDRAPRLARLRDRQLQVAVRGDRARAGPAREPVRARLASPLSSLRRAALRPRARTASPRRRGRSSALARVARPPLPHVRSR